MHFNPAWILLWAMVGITHVLSGQDRQVEKSELLWLNFKLHTPISDKWTAGMDAAYRTAGNSESLNQYLIRGTVFYEIKPGLTGAAGFAHSWADRAGEPIIREFRPYLELTNLNPFEHLTVANRFRFEPRFFTVPDTDEQWIARSLVMRFRYRIMLGIPIIKNLGKTGETQLGVSIGDEVALNAGKDVVYNVFDQNRFLLGPTGRFGPNWQVSVLYVHVFLARNEPASYSSINSLLITARHIIHFKKKQE